MKVLRTLAYAGASTLAVLWAAPSLAQQQTRQQAEEALAVPDNVFNAETVTLEPITILATRNPRLLLDVPASVTVIDQEELKRRMPRDIDDLVRYEPGITVDRRSSATDPFGSLGGFTIRGVSGNRIQMRIDGSRILDSNTDGTRDFVDMPFIKSVELMRGPASALYGTDAIGGLVAFQTKDPSDIIKEGRIWGADLNTGFDTYNNAFTNTALGAWRPAPGLEFMLGYSIKTAEEGKLAKAHPGGGIYGCPRWVRFGAIDCSELNPLDEVSQNAIAKLVWRPNETLELKLTGEIFDRHREADILYNKGPASTTRLPNGSPATPYPFINQYKGEQDLTRYRLALDGTWTPGYSYLDKVTWNFAWSPQKRVYTNYEDRTLALAGSGGQLPGNKQITANRTEYGQTFYQGGLQFDSSFAIGPTGHRLTYGLEGELSLTDYFRQQTRSVGNGAPVVSTPQSWNFADSETQRIDAYLQDEISLLDGRLLVTPAVRFSWNDITPKPKSDYKPVPGYDLRERQESALTKKLGAVYKFNDTYSIYGLYSEGFRMPNAEQLYTGAEGVAFSLVPAPNLKPEEVRSYEAGLRGKFAWGYFSASAFYADYTDFINNFAEVPRPGGGSDYTWQNLAKVQLRGVELNAEVAWTENWQSRFSATYQRGDQQSTPGASWTPFNGASPFTAVASLRWLDPAKGLELEVVGTFAADVERASAPNIFMPSGYAVFDVLGSWKPLENVTLKAGMYNAFDKRYFRWPMPTTFTVPGSSSVAFSNPLELQTATGRTFKFGANVTF